MCGDADQVRSVVPDAALLQLLVAWLSPSTGDDGLPEAAALALPADATVENVRAWKPGYEATAVEDIETTTTEPPLQCCRAALGLPAAESCPLLGNAGSCPELDAAAAKEEDRPPLQVGYHLWLQSVSQVVVHLNADCHTQLPPSVSEGGSCIALCICIHCQRGHGCGNHRALDPSLA